MNADPELDAWRGRWQSEAGIQADLRQRVSRETRRMRRSVLKQVTVTVVYGGVSAGWAWASRRPDAVVLAVGIWVFIVVAWALSLLLHRGAWTPVTQTTTSFLDLSVLRGQRFRAAILARSVFYVLVLTFVLSWIHFETFQSETIWQFLTSGSLLWVWVTTAAFGVLALRRWRGLGRELRNMRALREQMEPHTASR